MSVQSVKHTFSGETLDDRSVINGFILLEPFVKGYSISFKCVAPACGHETNKTASSMVKSATGMCRECSWKLVNTKSHMKARRGSGDKTYNSWRGMLDRCENPNHTAYDTYGGAGIVVCDNWRGDNGFINFLSDMGERPEGTSIDRIDSELGYSKDNCRWASKYQQSQNRKFKNSKYRTGVRKHQNNKGWVATLGFNGVKHYLGYYQSYGGAVRAREAAEIMYYGRVL